MAESDGSSIVRTFSNDLGGLDPHREAYMVRQLDKNRLKTKIG